MKIQSILILAVATFFTTGTALASMTQWSIEDGGNGHYYEAFYTTESITWDEAQNEAVSMGGYLVTITSEQENEFVFSLIQSPDYWSYRGGFYVGPWTGGIQQPGSVEPAGGWGWITGEPFSFTAWDTIQPNNTDGVQDRIHFWNQYEIAPTWQDVRLDSPSINSYVVEVVPLPSALLLGIIGTAFSGWFIRKRKYIDLR